MNNRFYMTVIIVFLIFPFVACRNSEKPVDIYSQLQEVNRLELARMTVGKVGMISDPEYKEAKSIEDKARALFNTMKIGTRIGVYSYDTFVVAYVDLSKLSPEDIQTDPESMTAVISLPPVEIMFDGREPQLHEEHYRVSGLRSSITPAERAALKAQMAKEVKQELAKNTTAAESLRDAAEAKGIAWLSGLLENWGYSAEITYKQ